MEIIQIIVNFFGKHPMFIKIEETPNPETYKFIPVGRQVAKSTQTFSAGDSTGSKLADMIFSVMGIKSIFFGREFISITRENEDVDWDILKPEVITVVMDYYASEDSKSDEEKSQEGLDAGELAPWANKFTYNEEEKKVVEQVIELLDDRVKPAIEMDGGHIEFIHFKEGTVYLLLQGACAGCPSSTVTLKQGIESMMKHYIVEVEAVEQIFEEDIEELIAEL